MTGTGKPSGSVSRSNRVLLGHIAGAHGIRGDVLIRTFTALPESIGDYGPLGDEQGLEPLDVRVVRVTPKGVVARIAGVADRNAAERLKGRQLFVVRDRLPPPDPNEFYHEDLAGLEAVDPVGRIVGKVVAVRNFGAGDLLEIAFAGGRQTEFLPFTEAVVPAIDLAAGRVTLILPEFAPDDGPPPPDDVGDALTGKNT